jgi:deoxyribodipyrimidine photo-lyase
MVTETQVNTKRVRSLNKKSMGLGPVVYWMSRDQRATDNWALNYALEIAEKNQRQVEVVFCLASNFPSATDRHYFFMLEGLKETEEKLSELGIKFTILYGEVDKEIISFTVKNQSGCLVTDFSPLKIGRVWRSEIAKKIDIAMYEVDAHNIVPVWVASSKKEWAAYTIRPKINAQLGEFLTEFPKLKPIGNSIKPKTDWDSLYAKIKPPKGPLLFHPGTDEAMKRLEKFLSDGIWHYSEKRNDPSNEGQSSLSPYLHFGHISSQRVAAEVKKLKQDENTEAFLEELVIRKELSDNFCFYEDNYDNPLSFPDWAKKSLEKHKNDKRDYTYSLEEFELSKTHDEAWNAAQTQMVNEGKMHGYMRMYWAKKILEWTESVESAMKIAIYLNDKYQLDGRDPNGYAGIAWSLGGVHDRPWFEREVFGQIRYMNKNGLEKKFDLKRYVSKYSK